MIAPAAPPTTVPIGPNALPIVAPAPAPVPAPESAPLQVSLVALTSFFSSVASRNEAAVSPANEAPELIAEAVLAELVLLASPPPPVPPAPLIASRFIPAPGSSVTGPPMVDPPIANFFLPPRLILLPLESTSINSPALFIKKYGIEPLTFLGIFFETFFLFFFIIYLVMSNFVLNKYKDK